MSRKALYDELTRDFTIALGKQESKKQREANGAKKASQTYGEIEFESISLAIKWIQATQKDGEFSGWHNAFNLPGGKFMDLGHGTGKVVLSAALMHPFAQSSGIELFETLYTVSCDLKQIYADFLTATSDETYLERFSW